jgi:hypothetical protein
MVLDWESCCEERKWVGGAGDFSSISKVVGRACVGAFRRGPSEDCAWGAEGCSGKDGSRMMEREIDTCSGHKWMGTMASDAGLSWDKLSGILHLDTAIKKMMRPNGIQNIGVRSLGIIKTLVASGWLKTQHAVGMIYYILH